MTLTSPTVELTTDDAEVFFSTWVFSAGGTPDALVIQLSRNGGVDWVDIDTVPSAGEWVWHSFRLSEFPEITGNELRVRFSIADTPNDSLTEAAVDEFLVRAIHCTFAFGDTNLDGNVDLLDWKELVSCMNGPATSSLEQPCPRGDFDLNSTIDLRDVGAFQNAVDSP